MGQQLLGTRPDVPTGRVPERGMHGGDIPVGRRGDQIFTTRVGLRLPRDVSFDRWERAGVQLSRIVDSFAWCLGDWLVYGQERFPDRYRRAVDAVGLEYQTLRNYASVARRVEVSRRRWRLSFQHHAEVASLSEADQEDWLGRAEQAGWSRNQLRQHLQRSRPARATKAATTVLPKLTVPRDRADRWREAATLAGSEFDNWVVAALDQAAARELDS